MAVDVEEHINPNMKCEECHKNTVRYRLHLTSGAWTGQYNWWYVCDQCLEEGKKHWSKPRFFNPQPKPQKRK